MTRTLVHPTHTAEPSAASAPPPRSAAAIPSPTRAARGLVARLAASHVIQFLVLGGAIFAIVPRPSGGGDVHLSRAQLAAMYGAEARRVGAPLDATKQREVDARAIEDEVLYREALRLGLDRGDGIVRQRLIQKALFFAEELGGAARPATEADLRAYFDATRDRWIAPERLRFVHVFASANHLAELEALRPAALATAGDEPPALGEPFPVSRSVSTSRDDLAADLGAPFADAVAALPVSTWSAPLASKLGLHLVKVLAHDEARPQTFAEARDRLKLPYLVDRKQKATEAFLARAFTRYRVDVDGAGITAPRGTGRTAPAQQREED